MVLKKALWLDYPLEREIKVQNAKDTSAKKYEKYTNREEYMALPYPVLCRLGDAEKLEPLKVPDGFGYLWENFGLMRQLCGEEISLADANEYVRTFMPEATRTDIFMLVTMSNTARAFTQKMDKDEAEWPRSTAEN